MTNSGGNVEFERLKEHVRNQAPVTTAEVHKAVDEFFKDVVWSLLKEEWQDRMNAQQREALCSKLLLDAVTSTTSKMRTLKLDDIDLNNGG